MLEDYQAERKQDYNKRAVMDHISEILSVERICDLSASTKDEALVELCALSASSEVVKNREKFLEAIRKREIMMSTGIGGGIAIPHSKTSALSDFILTVGRARQGIDFDSLDGMPVYLILMIGASDTQGNEFLRVLKSIGTIFSNDQALDTIMAAPGPEDIYQLLIDRV